MLNRIWCLSVTNFSMFPELRDELFRAACHMILNKPEKGSNRRKIRGEVFEGVVHTEFRYGYLGSVCGYVFTAELDLNGIDEQGFASFIIRGTDVEYWLMAIEAGSIVTREEPYDGPGIRFGNPPGN